jgi:hypothetical protein
VSHSFLFPVIPSAFCRRPGEPPLLFPHPALLEPGYPQIASFLFPTCITILRKNSATFPCSRQRAEKMRRAAAAENRKEMQTAWNWREKCRMIMPLLHIMAGPPCAAVPWGADHEAALLWRCAVVAEERWSPRCGEAEVDGAGFCCRFAGAAEGRSRRRVREATNAGRRGQRQTRYEDGSFTSHFLWQRLGVQQLKTYYVVRSHSWPIGSKMR